MSAAEVLAEEEPVVIRAQPGPQMRATRSPADILIYGGQAGGGKSWWLVYDPMRYFGTPGFSGILFRRTNAQLLGAGSLWELTQDLYPLVGGRGRANVLDWRFPAGVTMQLAHLHLERDKLNHQGKQYAFIGWDELTHFKASQFWYLQSRARSTCGVRAYTRATCNPDPDSWVRGFIDWWIGEDGYPLQERAGKMRWFFRIGDDLVWGDNPEQLAEQNPSMAKITLPQSVTFVPSSLSDNPALTSKDPTYRARLMSLPLVEREQLLGGNWNVRAAAGLYFKRSYFKMVQQKPAGVVRTVRCWDKAATEPGVTNPDPDWTRGVKVSLLRSGYFVVEHVESLRGSPFKVENAIRSVAEQDGVGTMIGLWQDPGQGGKVDIEHMVRKLVGFHVEVEVASHDKLYYAGPVSSQAEAGNVLVLEGPWNEDFFRELESFPEGTHDDIVDALSRCFQLLTGAADVHQYMQAIKQF